MDAIWKQLDATSAPAACPPLFAKTHFTSNSYVVFLTDLRHIWKEDMDRKSIFKRALLEETPIDPTEDAAQASLLLDHIRGAVEGRPGTRRQLTKNVNDPHSLSLHLTAALPGSLGDLHWILHCKPLPPASLQHHVVSPLVRTAYDHMQQVDALIAQLDAKDHVISKLLDRLESSGTDVTSVFPGAAGAKNPSQLTPREQAARQVQGLGPFDSTKWRQSHAGNQEIQVPDESLSRLLGACRSYECAEHELGADYVWLSALPSAVGDAVDRFDDAFVAANRGDPALVDEEDAFERQDTPPRLKKHRDQQNPSGLNSAMTPSKKAYTRDPDETTDDEEPDVPSSQHSNTQNPALAPAPLTVLPLEQRLPMPSPSPTKLGTLGGKSSKQPTKKSANTGVVAQEESTASETEDEEAAHVSKAPEAEIPRTSSSDGAEKLTRAAPRRGKLGVLGGKKAADSTSTSNTPPAIPFASSETQSRHGTTHSVGLSLGDAEAEKTQAADDSPRASVSRATLGRSTSMPDPAAPAESEQDRANRKREELKRTLEKSQGPKKKRKF